VEPGEGPSRSAKHLGEGNLKGHRGSGKKPDVRLYVMCRSQFLQRERKERGDTVTLLGFGGRAIAGSGDKRGKYLLLLKETVGWGTSFNPWEASCP